ncbi:MAG: hypothetical protein P9L99_08355 [Candidatus Lernaella stagnicola]|nr:hypothetical protein [Candidatus Lernaella stagnicola]
MTSRWRWLVLLVVFAGVMRVGLVLVAPPIEHSDSLTFSERAEKIQDGRQIDAYRTPLYPLFLAAVFARGGDWMTAVILQHLLGLIGVVFVFLAAEAVFAPRPAFVLAFAYSAEWMVLGAEHSILSEALSTPIWAFVIWLVVRKLGNAPRPINAVTVGVAVALCALARPVFLAAVLAMPPLIFWVWRGRRQYRVGLAAACAATSVIFLLPWMLYQQSRLGEVTMGRFAGRNLTIKIVDLIDEDTPAEPRWRDLALQTIEEGGWAEDGWIWMFEMEKNEAMHAIFKAVAKRVGSNDEADGIVTDLTLATIKQKPLGYLKNVALTMFMVVVCNCISFYLWFCVLVGLVCSENTKWPNKKAMRFVVGLAAVMFVTTYAMEDNVDRYILSYWSLLGLILAGVGSWFSRRFRKEA